MIPNVVYALLASAVIPTAIIPMTLPVAPGVAMLVLLAVLLVSGALLWLVTKPETPLTKPRPKRAHRPTTIHPLPHRP